MSGNGNRSSKDRLAILYGYRCLLTNVKTKKLTFHHLSKKEWGGPASVENGANLTKEAHEWIHYVETQDFETFMDLNDCLALYKKCIDMGMTELIQDYETEIIPKVRERIKRQHYGKR